MHRVLRTSVTTMMVALLLFTINFLLSRTVCAQQGPEFIGSGAVPPAADANQETQGKLADMKNYLAAGRRRYVLADSYIRWPLSESLEKYAPLNGDHIKGYVNEITSIAQQSQSDGNQYWGRIVGTKYDLATDEWLMAKLKAAGVQDVKRQELDVPPQWWGNSWAVTIGSGSDARKLESAFPFVNTPGTSKEGLDLEGGICRSRQKGGFCRTRCARKGSRGLYDTVAWYSRQFRAVVWCRCPGRGKPCGSSSGRLWSSGKFFSANGATAFHGRCCPHFSARPG